MEHIELPSYRHSFTCSCGVAKVGTRENPALFSDHLMDLFKESEGR